MLSSLAKTSVAIFALIAVSLFGTTAAQAYDPYERNGFAYPSSSYGYAYTSDSHRYRVYPDYSAQNRPVMIANFAYSPQNITVRAGDTVTWINYDTAPHTVTSNDGGPLDSGSVSRGESYSYTFTSPGTYSYYCEFHPMMRGTVTVVDEASYSGANYYPDTGTASYSYGHPYGYTYPSMYPYGYTYSATHPNSSTYLTTQSALPLYTTDQSYYERPAASSYPSSYFSPCRY